MKCVKLKNKQRSASARVLSERAVTCLLARVLIFFKQALAYFERP